MSAANIVIKPVTASERAEWEPLWKGYLDFYDAKVSRETYDTTWARLQDPNEPMYVLGAYVDGRLIGIVHYLYHRSCWTSATTAICRICSSLKRAASWGSAAR